MEPYGDKVSPYGNNTRDRKKTRQRRHHATKVKRQELKQATSQAVEEFLREQKEENQDLLDFLRHFEADNDLLELDF